MELSGDPTWLEAVLRDALGDRLVVHDGWQECGTGAGEHGTGQMGPIWGVLIHHTGNVNERWETIRKGTLQPTGWLKGPLSQGLITPDGQFHLVAVGPCNHAGRGCYPGVPDDTANTRLIGFECAWQGGEWPAEQLKTMRDATAAVLAKLGYDSTHVIGHKEWAGDENPLHRFRQGEHAKWDPGMDMNSFRADVAKTLRGEFKKFETQYPETTQKVEAPMTNSRSDRQLLEEIWDQLRGPEGNGWPQLGGKSLVDAVAELLEARTRRRSAEKVGKSETAKQGNTSSGKSA